MKILTIHDAHLDLPDFCWGIEGEVAVTPVICDSPSCGCDRSHTGLNSHKGSTTVMVRDVDLDLDDFTTASAGFLESAGWAKLFDIDGEVREEARAMVAHSVDAAADYPVGAVLRRVFNRDREVWRYEVALP